MICFIVVSPIAVVFSPFIGIWYSCKWLYKHLSKKKVEEVQPEIKSHVTPKPNYGRFLFKEDREVKIPIDKIVYVETSPDEAISTFLEEDKDWIRFWQEWYGIDIINVDYDTIKQSRFIHRTSDLSNMALYGRLEIGLLMKLTMTNMET